MVGSIRTWGFLVCSFRMVWCNGQSEDSPRLCKIQQLVSLDGQISGKGWPPGSETKERCAWHIHPGIMLESINFRVDALEIHGDDHLAFYIAPPHKSRPIAFATATSPLQSEISLSGSNEVLLILNAEAASTHFSLSYECVPAGRRIGSVYLPVILYYMVLSAFAFVCILFFVTLIYWLCYCRARRTQQQTLRSSFRILVGELPQHRVSAQVEERTVGALQALPRTTWTSAKENAGGSKSQIAEGDEQCCLCLESYESENEVRVLPCSHYFHTECIDNWFAARSFMPRSCPQCRQNPVPATGLANCVDGGVHADVSSGGLQAAQQTQTDQGDHSNATSTDTSNDHLQSPSIVTTYGRTPEAETSE